MWLSSPTCDACGRACSRRGYGSSMAITRTPESFLIFVPLALPKGEFLALNLGLAVAAVLILVTVMMRFGLLAAAVALVTYTLLQSAPLMLGTGAWQAGPTVLVLAIVLGLGSYGF